MTAPPPTRAAPTRRILLVDDNADFTDAVKAYLLMQRQPAWIVHTAGNYAEALDCLKVNAVDLVVTDIKMPVMDGLQLLTLLKRTRPSLPVVVLTSLVTAENRSYALQNGAALILDKMEVASNFEVIYAALEATAEAPAAGFKGMLREVGLTDLIQMECLSRKSSTLQIKGPNATGKIFISDGSIIHAEFEALVGEKALAKLLGLKGGEFQLGPFAAPLRQTIDGNWESLLMEAAQSCDEESEQEPAAPPLEAPAISSAGRRIEEIVVCASANDVLYQWNAPQAERRGRLLDWLWIQSSTLGKMFPGLGQMDRFEITEPQSRVVCLLQAERKVFVRVSMPPPQA
ncbi:MAG TPA: response regulator [Verrucomicrobiae bacterium]|jgi:CheY-like chemotaxis protein|nr:response regulator [Verrucomicrobiae bacterium]